MALILATSQSLPPRDAYDFWAGIDGAEAPGPQAAGLAPALERAFDAVLPEWRKLAGELAGEPSAELAHTPAMAANISDFGLMLAWTRLAGQWAVGPKRILLVCDDPWLFRHLVPLASLHSSPPTLWRREAMLFLRGAAARLAAAFRFALASIVVARDFPHGAAVLLVYGHPASRADGFDGYFGELMQMIPSLRRIFHVDTPPIRARQLGGASMHGWGGVGKALSLPLVRWRPARRDHWLVRRAAALEGSTATAAAIAWQIACQDAWLRQTRPQIVTWPWENHAWERDLVRRARNLGTGTLGYQHTTVGRQEWNHLPGADPNDDILPDRILCSGPAWRERLIGFGIPPERLAVGGSFRNLARSETEWSADGPVFAALPFDRKVAARMIEALRPLAESGIPIILRDHPMAPSPLTVPSNMREADGPLSQQPSLRAVVFAGTSVGLEAVMAGLPTIRFQPEGRPVIDVMPPGITPMASDAAGLGEAVRHATAKPEPVGKTMFYLPDREIWRSALTPTCEAATTEGKQ